MASVEERVVDIVAEQLGVSKEKVARDTSFVNDLGADSLDQVELVMELEEPKLLLLLVTRAPIV